MLGTAGISWHWLTALLILRETVRQLSAHLHHWLVREEVQTVQSCTEPLILPAGGHKQVYFNYINFIADNTEIQSAFIATQETVKLVRKLKRTE